MVDFLDKTALLASGAKTGALFSQFRSLLDRGLVTRTIVKQEILDLRAAGDLDDGETEGLIARLDLADA